MTQNTQGGQQANEQKRCHFLARGQQFEAIMNSHKINISKNLSWRLTNFP